MKHTTQTRPGAVTVLLIALLAGLLLQGCSRNDRPTEAETPALPTATIAPFETDLPPVTDPATQADTDIETDPLPEPETEAPAQPKSDIPVEPESSVETDPPAEPTPEPAALTAPYADVLAEYLDLPNARFLLTDIDDDMVPEMILAPDSFHMAPAEVYTIKDGTAVQAGTAGGFGELLATHTEGLFATQERYISNYYIFYQLSDGTAQQVASFRDGPEDMQSEDVTYEIDGAYVTLEEYESRLKTYFTHEFRQLGHPDGWEVTRENIDGMLQDPSAFYALGRDYTPYIP